MDRFRTVSNGKRTSSVSCWWPGWKTGLSVTCICGSNRPRSGESASTFEGRPCSHIWKSTPPTATAERARG